MRTTWVIGNWKMNGDLAQNATLLNELSISANVSHQMAVCVPFPYLAQAKELLVGRHVVLAAQDVSQFDSGAYTGEISALMLKEFGVQLVLVGHSERRQFFGETDAVVAAKTQALLNAGLAPVLCMGETLAEREAGVAKATVLAQLSAVADVIGVQGLSRCILAYEPIWAIGTGKTASAEQAQEVHAWLRVALHDLSADLAQNISVLYGGSVKPSNAAEIFKGVDVDGGLIGGASLVGSDFMAIYQAALL